MVPLDGRINGNPNIPLMTCFDLLFEKVSIQMRMTSLGKSFGIKIDVTVMTAGKTGYGVHMRSLQRIGEFIRLETIANICNMLARVKVQVNLTKGQRKLRTFWG